MPSDLRQALKVTKLVFGNNVRKFKVADTQKDAYIKLVKETMERGEYPIVLIVFVVFYLCATVEYF